ncbi:hypothetical protein [Parasphingorhabdus halotolerans]|uniref:Uncharacterized protein n=1 Tax=Parasphingorhabdus halotolerans TaxID=2725558 RepID=A0A6H2DN06_9SPHN|nr:hypothetical protein [Parasphingorhabdus halotolerans]QJB70052.1 hypothetical protein HF685_12765 [Parasphingorhabdus halotolerans]
MKTLMIMALAAIQAPAATAPTAVQPLSDIHQRDLLCVAALAIVASEQERGIESALDYPLLAERGKTYAGLIGERIMTETGRTREQVRADILSAVAMQQAKVMDVAEPGEVVDAEMAKCLPLLDQEVPPKPQPSLNQCAALLELAYEEVYGREGLSKTAQDLKTLAYVLDSRAREKMKAEGYSGTESDIVLTQLREEMHADAKRKEAKGQSSDLDFEHCFALAAPESKQQKYEH